MLVHTPFNAFAEPSIVLQFICLLCNLSLRQVLLASLASRFVELLWLYDVNELADFKLTSRDDEYILAALAFSANDSATSIAHLCQLQVKVFHCRSGQQLQEWDLLEELLQSINFAPVDRF